MIFGAENTTIPHPQALSPATCGKEWGFRVYRQFLGFIGFFSGFRGFIGFQGNSGFWGVQKGL